MEQDQGLRKKQGKQITKFDLPASTTMNMYDHQVGYEYVLWPMQTFHHTADEMGCFWEYIHILCVVAPLCIGCCDGVQMWGMIKHR